MTAATLTLSGFLLARIAEDEAAARHATPGLWRHDPTKEWHADPEMLARARGGKLTYGGEEFVKDSVGECIAATGPADDARSMADALHIARHDPARVLAECEARRRIIDHCGAWSDEWAAENLGGQVLAALARPYADHPDFRAEWRP